MREILFSLLVRRIRRAAPRAGSIEKCKKYEYVDGVWPLDVDEDEDEDENEDDTRRDETRAESET